MSDIITCKGCGKNLAVRNKDNTWQVIGPYTYFSSLDGNTCFTCIDKHNSNKETFKKNDSEKKLRPELIPPEFLIGLSIVLKHGADNYGADNWEKGTDYSRYVGALLRHLLAWLCGEERDPDSGHYHLWHAGCCIAFLSAHEIRGLGRDNRPCTRTTKLLELLKGLNETA